MYTPTINFPPAKYIIVPSHKPRKTVYTINNYKGNPYAIQFKRTNDMIDEDDNDSESLKTTHISFSQHKDATLFACILESHKRQTKEWPNVTTDISNFFVSNDVILYKTPTELYVESQSLESLQLKCAKNMIDLAILTEIATNLPDKYYLRGQIIKLEMDLQYIVEHLNYTYFNDNIE